MPSILLQPGTAPAGSPRLGGDVPSRFSSPPNRTMILRRTLISAAVAAIGLPAFATEQVIVTGSIAERRAAEAPYAISVVDRDTLRAGGPQINLSEALARVPGLLVANRSNFAQDLQITSRGYGARATFGVRGIRLYADGIPASGPDGQGQVSQFDLAGAERVEVLRGPFSVLYGNSSGGVVSLVTAPVKQSNAEAEVDVGSDGLRQLRGALGLKLGGGLDLRVGAAAMQTDGFRPQSEAARRLLTARLGWQGARDSVVVSASAFSQPADDPLGLDRAQFDADPLSTAPQATQFDTRKTQTQRQLGAIWKHRYDAGALRETQLMAYAGRRSVTQYLAIAQGPQNAPSHGGGVIDFDRSFKGLDARVRFGWDALDLQVGAALDDQQDDRQGYENYATGSNPPQYGVQGRLRRDEDNRARTRDVYAQLEWAATQALQVSGGVRSGRVKLSVDDQFISPPNLDDSGAVSYRYTNPVLGLRWQAAPGLNLHVSAARGYESPTLGEIAYRSDGGAGPNLGLQAQTSRQFELGAKWRGTGGADLDVALFRTTTEDEIAVVLNAGGRASFNNVGRTLRRGLEVGAGTPLGAGFSSRVAYTFLDATYLDDFTTCTNLPCNAANPQNLGQAKAGNRIAGTQRHNGFAELAWDGGRAGAFGLELRGLSGTAANDVNTEFTDNYTIASLRWAWKLPTAFGGVELLARVDNLTDKRYAGSVIVNESNRRFFEPGAPRSYLLALRVNGNL